MSDIAKMSKTQDVIAAFDKSSTFTSSEAVRARRPWRKSPIESVPKSPIKPAMEVTMKHKSVLKDIPEPSEILDLKHTAKGAPKDDPIPPARPKPPIDKLHTTFKRVVQAQLANQIREFSAQHERLEEELLKTQIENELLKKRQLELEENMTKLSQASIDPPKPPPKDEKSNSRPATQLIMAIQTIIGDHEHEKYQDLSTLYSKLRGQQRVTRERYETLRQEHRTLQRKFDTFSKLATEHIGTIEVRLRDLQDQSPYVADRLPPVPKKDNVSGRTDLARAWRHDVQAGMRRIWREFRETQMRCARLMERLVRSAREDAEQVLVMQRDSHWQDRVTVSPTRSEEKELPELPG